MNNLRQISVKLRLVVKCFALNQFVLLVTYKGLLCDLIYYGEKMLVIYYIKQSIKIGFGLVYLFSVCIKWSVCISQLFPGSLDLKLCSSSIS